MPPRFVTVLFVLVLSGCTLLEAELELGEVCVTHRDVHVEGVALPAIAFELTSGELAQLHELVDLDAELALVRAEFRVTDGPGDLTRIDRAELSLAAGAPDSTLARLVAYGCAGDCAGTERALVIPAGVQRDIVEYLRASEVILGVALEGTLPAEPWTMEVDVCMDGHVSTTIEP